MTENNITETQQAYAQAQKYGHELATLYAMEKQRRKELEATTQKLQAIFDTAPNGLVVIDDSLAIIEANPHFLNLFEQTTDCIGQPLKNILPVDGLLKLIESIKTDMLGLGDVEIEITEPVFRTVLVTLATLSADQKWILILHDLTEQKRLEGLKDEFINIAAHELRTPLAGVMGFVGVLQEQLADTDDKMTKNLVNLILQSTHRLKAIIDELIGFVATRRNAINNLNVGDINLNEFVEKSIRLLQRQIDAKKISCHFELPREYLIIQGDQFILNAVLYQLLRNAIVFNKTDGKIIIRVQILPFLELTAKEQKEMIVKKGEKFIIIEIVDTGIGVPQTAINKIFDRFYQVQEHLTRGVGGLGLGLTIARHGVEQHGGQLTVKSKLGQGTVFRIILPAIIPITDISVDTRIDVAHQQMLTYAKDMARAVASERKMRKQMNRVQILSVELAEKLNRRSTTEPDSDLFNDTLSQAKDITRQLVELSAQKR